MRAVIAIAAVLLFLTPSPGHSFKRTTTNQALKDFSLETVDGQPLRLSEHLGRKATLVVFWALWSPRSVEALTDFQKLYAAHGPQDLQVVAVNVEHQEWDPAVLGEVVAYVEKNQLTFPVVFDKDLSVFNAYGVIAVPSTVLADAGGHIVELLESYSYMTRHDFRDRILEHLGVLEKKPEVEQVEVGYRPKGKAARYYQMGTLLQKKKQPRRALKAFEKAVKEDPDYAAAHLRLAELYQATGKEEEAAAARARAAALGTGVVQPGDHEPAEGSTKEVSPASAVQSSRSKGAQPQGNAARYVRMGNLLLKKQMPSQAIDVFQKAVERDPEYREAYLGLAKALEADGRTVEAEQARTAAAALEPSLGSESEVSKGKSSE